MPRPNASPNASSSLPENHQAVMRGSIDAHVLAERGDAAHVRRSRTGTAHTSASSMMSVCTNSMYELDRTPPSAV